MNEELHKLHTLCINTPLCIEIPELPPGVNNLYATNRMGRRFKVSSAVKWQRTAEILTRVASLEAYGVPELSRLKGLPVKLELLFCKPTWKGKSSPKKGLYVRPDLDGFLKCSIDAVFEALGLDDSAVIDLSASKTEREGPIRTLVRLQFVDEVNN